MSQLSIIRKDLHFVADRDSQSSLQPASQPGRSVIFFYDTLSERCSNDVNPSSRDASGIAFPEHSSERHQLGSCELIGLICRNEHTCGDQERSDADVQWDSARGSEELAFTTIDEYQRSAAVSRQRRVHC
ncbi:hypothetical protein QR680_006365 [Steinernema hermaphroditum]|uniref:Uncharacterized protein n=1 Tax=Steinernema hermaphroditum TaxID=289476 RepID=A0AA39HWF1_9BILA|nr:hypothetical protein QR680_006365 [Steinernema hermaphroditum]